MLKIHLMLPLLLALLTADSAIVSAEDVKEIDTVAGLVNALAGRVPQRREVITHPDGYTFEVLAASPRQIKRVRVRRSKVWQVAAT